MKQHDKIIKDALQLKMESLNSPDFTGKIVKQHLAKKTERSKYYDIDFLSLISGLVFVLISLIITILISADKIKGFTLEHSMILISLAVIYLIYRLLNEITAFNMRCRSFG